MHKSQGLVKGTLIISSLTLVSRVLGFVRDLLIARLFGAGLTADAFFVAFRMPNLLRSFIAEGALTSAFVPIFSKELGRGRQGARKVMSETVGLLISVTILLSLLGIIFAPQLTMLIAPGFEADADKFQLCVSLMRIMFPYIIFVSLVAVSAGALNTVKIFGFSPLAQIVMNCSLIAGALIAGLFGPQASRVLAYAVITGGALQVASQLPGLRKAKLSLIPKALFWSPAVKQLLVLMLPAVLGAAVYQISIFINTILASLLREGSVSWLFYADRLVQLPIGIFSIALASVLLPALSIAAVDNDRSLFAKNLVDALRYTTFLMIPVSVGLFFTAKPLVTVLFQRGAFSAHAASMTALAIKTYCIGIWGVSTQSMLIRAFLAKRDTITPALTALAALCISVVVSLAFMGDPVSGRGGTVFESVVQLQGFIRTVFGPEQAVFLNLGHCGLALGSSVGSISGFLILMALLRHREKGIDLQSFYLCFGKTSLSALIMGVVLYGFSLYESDTIIFLIAEITAGVTVFFISSRLFKTRELNEAFRLTGLNFDPKR